MSAPEDNEERDWLVWSTEHRGFWRPGALGYTQERDKAARYTMIEAEKICADANRYSNRIEEFMVKDDEGPVLRALQRSNPFRPA